MRGRCVFILAFVLLAAMASAQVPPGGIPPVIRFSGTVPGAAGVQPVTFALYAEQTGGVPLWTETQMVPFGEAGRYDIVLGEATAEGLPVALFADGMARWLGVEVDGGPPQARILLTSVAYALKASDASTIGGKPLSAFLLTGETTGVGPDGLTYIDKRVIDKALSGTFGVAPTSAGNPGYIGMFTSPTDLGNSVMFQSGGSVGVNTMSPAAGFHVAASAAPGVFFDVYNNSLGALPVVYRAARGTPSAPLPVQAGDILGGLAVRGYTPSGFSEGKGQVMFRAAQNWTDTANGTYLQFTTTPLNSTVFTERMRITPEGHVGIGTAAPQFPFDQRLSRWATYARFGGVADPLFIIADQPMLGFNAYFDAGWKYGSAGHAGYFGFGQDGAGNFSFATAPIGATDGAVTMTPRMVILNDGKVGIGNLAPTRTLDVTGTLNATGAISTGSSVTAADAINGGWGNFNASGAGFYAVQGVSIGTGATVGVRGQVTSATGKAFTGIVNGVEVMSADVDGVHAGPGMTGTPLAHGTFSSTGSKYQGSANISCAWEAAFSRYSCPIAGVDFLFSDYTTIVTPFNGPYVARTSSVSGTLLVYFYNLSGAGVQSGFSVVVFKQ